MPKKKKKKKFANDCRDNYEKASQTNWSDRIYSLKYQKSLISGWKDILIKNQSLCQKPSSIVESEEMLQGLYYII